MIVTTSHRALTIDVEAANHFAADIGGRYLPRGNQSLVELQNNRNEKEFVVMEKGNPTVYQDGTRLIFHRGMSELRILNLIRSGSDPLVAALGIEKGMSILDCTLGLASDALVAAFAAGMSGKVLGLEASPLIAALTRWGLQDLSSENADARSATIQAAGRINVLNVNHKEFLTALPTRSFDVIYFDPMFRHAKPASCGIRSLRSFAEQQALCKDSIDQALRVARSRVVVKEARGSSEFARLGIRRFAGGRYSPVQYGILNVEDKI